MKFVKNTRYYSGVVYEWNLPTGWTCPYADQCLVRVNKDTGKFENKSNQYRCYAANAERFPGVREHRWKNLEWVKEGKKPIPPKQAKSIRIHASGDFYNQDYFDMWLEVAKENPDIEFWAYTKSLKYWVNRLGQIPSNLVLTASYGGKNDELIRKHNLKNAVVIPDEKYATDRPIDYNDDLARVPNLSFYLIDNFKPKKKNEN